MICHFELYVSRDGGEMDTASKCDIFAWQYCVDTHLFLSLYVYFFNIANTKLSPGSPLEQKIVAFSVCYIHFILLNRIDAVKIKVICHNIC